MPCGCACSVLGCRSARKRDDDAVACRRDSGDWAKWRDRWEYGHAVRAGLVTAALGALTWSLLQDPADSQRDAIAKFNARFTHSSRPMG